MANNTYQVTAPLVIIASADGKRADWYGYDGAIVPEGHNDARCKQLAKEGFLKVVKPEKPAAPSTPGPDTVEGILKEVGDDKDKAAAALELEKAKGADARSTLVTKLEEIVGA